MADATAGDRGSSIDLASIRQEVAEANVQLYRHLALYLQVLRERLPQQVERVCFHLCTQVHPRRYGRLSPERRLHLHRQLRQRIDRCSSLLTVEQLTCLARSLEEEQRQHRNQRQQRLLQRLLQATEQVDEAASDSLSSGDAGEQDPSEGQRPDMATSPGRLPPGSVRLQLSTPLDSAALGWGPPPDWLVAHADDLDDESEGSDADDASAEGWSDHDLSTEETSSDPLDAQDEGGPGIHHTSSSSADDPGAAALMAALMQGLLQGEALDPGFEDDDDEAGGNASQAPQAWPSDPAREQPPTGASAPGAAELRTALEAVSSPSHDGNNDAGPSPYDQIGLPDDPVLLLRWLEGFERALARRLRDLSHRLNVELLRVGLSRGLLPLHLLEAVLEGQIETLSSPANVLRLQLPFGLSPGAPPLQAIAILLRSTDLEMEELRLRTCRRRIHQHRQQVRKMAQTYRRLQRRLQAHEAERLWLQDIRASHNPSS